MIKSIQRLHQKDARLAMEHMYVDFAAVFVGATAGLLQVLQRTGKLELPAGIGYYQILTAHGVTLGFVMTSFFIIGFMLAGQSRTAGEYTNAERNIAWVRFWLMLVGSILAAVYILLNESTVLYTFYAPMMAHSSFYIGLTLVVVGTWFGAFVAYKRHRRFLKENPGERSPLFSFMVVINFAMWQIATLGVASAMLLQFIPWSLGFVDSIDVLVSRTLFWYFGHPLVYFWLLPAYMAWYVIIPKIIGAKIFSDALARLSFILLLLFSIPVGFHHQLTEPGIDPFWKYIQVILTFLVVIPSLMTAFSLFATFETRGR